MKFLAVASALLLAGSAVAAPNTLKRQAAHRKRIAGLKQQKGGPIKRVDGPAGNITDVSYSSNWAGAVITSTDVTEVTAEFTVPTPSSSGSGSAWVGIDGDSCETAILQTGIDWTKSGSDVTYDAWYEWYPDYSYDFSGISMSAGNQIKATVTATSKTGGKAVIENISTGESVTHSFSGEGSEGQLCQYDAEWIVEDFEEGDSLVSFADFGTVTFTDASATIGGSLAGTSGGSILDIEQDSVLTSCSIPSSSEVKCTYN